MKKQNLPNRSFLNYFAMQTIFIMFLFVINIFPQIIIKERVEINPIKQTIYRQTTEGDGWWIGGCYFEDYDSSEIDLRLEPSSIEPGETAIMKLYYCFSGTECEYDEEGYDLLERNLTLEPNLGTITRIGNGEYEYQAPNQTPGDTALVVTVNYEQFIWGCAFANGQKDSSRADNNNLQELDCGCPLWTWTFVSRHYGTDSIMIAWDSLDVKVVPDTIYPGDTAQVVIKKRLPNGTLIDFDSTQTYVAGMLDGCILGKLVAGEQEGAYVDDVSQPIYFVADTSADTTGSVLLRVGLVEVANKSQNNSSQQTDLVGSDCFIGGQFGSYEDVSEFVDEPIILSWGLGTHYISSVPEMPSDLTILIQPKQYVGEYQINWTLEVKWTSTAQDPDVDFAYPFINSKTDDNPDGTDLPLPETDPEIVGGDEITITGYYFDNKYPTGYHFTKKLEDMKILGENPEKQAIKDYIANHEYPTIDLPLSEEVDTDDQILQMQVIVLKESTWKQFKTITNEIGYPNMNPHPYDWGLCQLSKPNPTIEEIWNWEKNINSGIHLLWGEGYDEKYYQVKKEFNELKKLFTKDGKVPRDPNKREFLTMLSQRYKGGYYYNGYKHGKKDKDGYYTPSGTTGYGKDFWTKFEDVENGPPYPSGW